MSFYRAPFRSFVSNQLNTRVRLLIPENRNSDWYQHYLSKTAFLRVAPLVNIMDESITGKSSPTEFSKNYVLEGSPLIYDKGGEGSTKSRLFKPSQFPSQLNTSGNTNSLLNNPTLRTTPDSDGFGIVPPPGITSFSIKTKSFYGNLREATLSIRCFNISQFEIIEKIYSRPGHHVLIEWGWSHFLSYNNKTKKFEKENIANIISDVDNKNFWSDKVDAGKLYRDIDENKIAYKGCYDGFLGIVKNFDSSVEADGGFLLKIQLIGRGDLIDSMDLSRSGEIPDYVSPRDLFYIREVGTTNVKENKTINFITNGTEESAEIKKELAAYKKISTNTSNNLYNYLLYTIKQTLFNAIGKGDDDPLQLEALKIRKNIDSIALSDSSQTLNQSINSRENAALKKTWRSSFTEGLDTGLGPYIRLGHLIKVLNYLCIPSDGKGKPLVSINNLLYTSEFNPSNPSQKLSVYPSCYNSFISDFNNTNYPSKILENFDASPPEFQREIGWELYDYIIANKLDQINDNGAEDKSNASNIVIPRIVIPRTTNNLRLSFYTDGRPNPTKQKIKSGELVKSILKNSLTTIGSSSPSTVLFPHQFTSAENTEEVYTDIENKGEQGGFGKPGDAYNLRIATNFKDNLYKRGSKRLFELFTDPYFATINEGGFDAQVARRVDSSHTLISRTEEIKNGAPQAFYSDDAPSSLSTHAIMDALEQLKEGNKISETYYNTINKRFSKLLGIRERELRSGTATIAVPKVGLKKEIDSLKDRSNGLFNPTNVIDNIYINTLWLLDTIEGKNDITLNDLLTKICDQINKASGNSTELKVSTNPVFNDQISIIDFKVNSISAKKTKMFSFPKTGRTSIFKKIDLKGKIPSAQASSIAIAAQGPRNEGNILSVTYKAFIDDVQDRISISNSSTGPTAATLQNRNNDKYNAYKRRFLQYLIDSLNVLKLYRVITIHTPHTTNEWFSGLEGLAMSSLKRMNRVAPFLSSNQAIGSGYSRAEWDELDPKTQAELFRRFGKTTINKLIFNNNRDVVSLDNPSLPLTSVIPLEVTITMEGVSGILASNVFKLSPGILPDRYNQERVSYMIKSESQRINGLTWETSLTGLMVLDDVLKPPTSGESLTKDGVTLTDSKGNKETITIDPKDAESRFEDDIPVTELSNNQPQPNIEEDNIKLKQTKDKYKNFT
jgi:hypothetical protein